MKVASYFIILITLCSFSQDVLAKKLKRYRVKITHYDNSVTKGIIYDVMEDGIGLVSAESISYLLQSMIVKDVNKGKIQITRIPFNQIKNLMVRRKGSVGRSALIGSLGALALTTAITTAATLTKKEDNHCGCGIPAVLVLPPIAAFGGGLFGSIVGLFPKKTIVLDPNNSFESAQRKLYKYSIYTQIE